MFVPHSRFVFITSLVRGGTDEKAAAGVGWLLVSANNRPLGRSPHPFPTYLAGKEAVIRLQNDHRRLAASPVATHATARWTWRVRLDDEVVAVSSRAYLRMRECQYNLDRFLEAVLVADIATGVRVPRRGETDPRMAEMDGREADEDSIRPALTNSLRAGRGALKD